MPHLTIRSFSNENSESTFEVRKPGVQQTSRSPFKDRAVNSTSSSVSTITPKKFVDEEMADFEVYNAFSFKDYKDDYGDIDGKFDRLILETIRDILYIYCNKGTETPPPPLLMEEPQTVSIPSPECSFSHDDHHFSFTIVEDIELPTY